LPDAKVFFPHRRVRRPYFGVVPKPTRKSFGRCLPIAVWHPGLLWVDWGLTGHPAQAVSEPCMVAQGPLQLVLRLILADSSAASKPAAGTGGNR
jgi:hypothetical protein